MRRLTPRAWCGFLLVVAIAAVPACKRAHHADAVLPEQPVVLASVVNVADPDTSTQLTQGFYQVEDHAWRWTARKFSVALKTPPGAAQNGARLTLKFSFPAPVFQALGAMKVTASVNGRSLGSRQFSMPGGSELALDVPAGALAADAVGVEFECDKWLPPSAGEARELALVVTSIGLESK